jgi:hypothetical protein
MTNRQMVNMNSMNFTERLKSLVGHEIELTTSINSEDREIPAGILEEVGPDYVLVDTRKAEQDGYVESAAQWFVRTDSIVVAMHPSDCGRCAVEAALRPAAKQ